MIRRDFMATLPVTAGALGGLVACERARPALAHDFYVWQRVWKAPLDQAVGEAAAEVRTWRVLGLHWQSQGPPRRSDVHLDVLRATRRPVVLVVRIEGGLPRLEELAPPEQIQSLLAAWVSRGLVVEGLEIDHDCPSSKLGAYAQWLGRLRARLTGMRLSITALPAWMPAAGLPDVLAAVDEAVLQVHAVRQPSDGLFELAAAQAWIQRFAGLAPRPFRVALPCYSTRAGFNEWGELVAVESETPVGLRSTRERELSASPHEVSRLLSWLREKGPASVAGAVWFRLPTMADQRSWRLATWQAVIAHRPVPRSATAGLRPAGEPALYDVVLDNASAVDVDLPDSIALPAPLLAADGRQGYTLDLLPGPARLVRRQAGWLRPGSSLVIGWVRCTQRMDDVVLSTRVS